MLKLLFKIIIYTNVARNELRLAVIQHLKAKHKRFIRAIIYHARHAFCKKESRGTNGKNISTLKRAYATALLSMRRHGVILQYARLSETAATRDIKIISVFRNHLRRYKPFGVYGKDATLALSGGAFFSQHDTHTALFHNARVSGFCEGVLTKGRLWSLIEVDRPLSEFGCFHKILRPLGKKFFLMLRQPLRYKHVAKAVFFAGNDGFATNYFHFMVDVLPSLLLSLRAVRKRADGHEFIVFVPVAIHPNIQRIIHAVCEHFGHQTVALKPNQSYRCREVVMSGYPSAMGNALPTSENYSVSPAMIRYVRYVLRHTLPTDKKTENDSARYYLTRQNAEGASTTRHVKNHEEISAFLSPLGFRTVLAQNMSFEEQLAIFRATEYAVFDGGAAIANLVFAKHCKHIWVLAMNTGTDPSLFVSFCQALGIGASYVCGPTVENQEFVVSWQRNYRVDIETIAQALADQGIQ